MKKTLLIFLPALTLLCFNFKAQAQYEVIDAIEKAVAGQVSDAPQEWALGFKEGMVSANTHLASLVVEGKVQKVKGKHAEKYLYTLPLENTDFGKTGVVSDYYFNVVPTVNNGTLVQLDMYLDEEFSYKNHNEEKKPFIGVESIFNYLWPIYKKKGWVGMSIGSSDFEVLCDACGFEKSPQDGIEFLIYKGNSLIRFWRGDYPNYNRFTYYDLHNNQKAYQQFVAKMMAEAAKAKAKQQQSQKKTSDF